MDASQRADLAAALSGVLKANRCAGRPPHPCAGRVVPGRGVRSRRGHTSLKPPVCLLAVNGLNSPGLAKLLSEAPSARFDIVILSAGVNDVTALMPPGQWLEWQNRLAELVRTRFAPTLLIHSAVPPMHAFTALPQPLRRFTGRWAREMNRLLERSLAGHGKRTMHWHPPTGASKGLAIDGFHPGPHGYALWAEGLSRRVLSVH